MKINVAPLNFVCIRFVFILMKCIIRIQRASAENQITNDCTAGHVEMVIVASSSHQTEPKTKVKRAISVYDLYEGGSAS